jgi:hypothetical protein
MNGHGCGSPKLVYGASQQAGNFDGVGGDEWQVGKQKNKSKNIKKMLLLLGSTAYLPLATLCVLLYIVHRKLPVIPQTIDRPKSLAA